MPEIPEIRCIVNKIGRRTARVQSLVDKLSAISKESFPDEDAALLELYLDMAENELKKVQITAAYMSSPIVETSRLWKNGRGQYESTNGHCFYAGNDIEVLVPFKYEADKSYWLRTRLQHDGKDYYLAEYPDLSLVGLPVRVRMADKP